MYSTKYLTNINKYGCSKNGLSLMTGYIINTFAFLKALYAREAQQRRKQQNKDVANKIDLAYDLICMSRLILFHLN